MSLTVKQKELVELLKSSLPIIEDSVAVQNKSWFPVWCSNIEISVGDRYTYEGNLYCCIKNQTTTDTFEYENWVLVGDNINGYRIASSTYDNIIDDYTMTLINEGVL